MNPLKNRILSSRGFVTTAEDNEEDLEKVALSLKNKVLSLEKKLKNRDQHWEDQRDTAMIKMKEQVMNLERENKKLVNEMDKMKGRETQLLKEIEDVTKLVEKPAEVASGSKKKSK